MEREEGLAACKKLLDNEGPGHTAIIHTRSSKLVERFGSEILASRILVNAGVHRYRQRANALTHARLRHLRRHLYDR